MFFFFHYVGMRCHLLKPYTLMLPSTLSLVNVCLDRSNYNFWKSELLPTTQAYDLESFLLGNKSSPSKFVDDYVNPKFNHWN